MMSTQLPTVPQRLQHYAPMDGRGSFMHSHGTQVFMRPRLDDVKDAVAQAQFNERRRVWVQGGDQCYMAASIVHESNGEHKTIQVELENGEVREVAVEQVFPMNPPRFDQVDDMAELTHLNEPSVIHNLTLRYRADQIYTYSGLFLVAVNPYRNLPIYSDAFIQSYKGKRRGEMAPHIYAIADQAYSDMMMDKESQSILITGESGAGKTENTKIAIQYLAAIASGKDNRTGIAVQLKQQILEANPILEAFGNAQTVRNNNSSRFGKFIRIEFNERAQICGANIEWYLLERSRVHQQAAKERNYHIFYQLLSADEKLKEQLLLGGGKPSDYGFLKYSNYTIVGVDDAKEFQRLLRGLEIMGFTEKERFDHLRVIAAILHLGNIVVTPDYRGERADIRDFASIERVCHLLGVQAQDFKKGILSPRFKAGRDSWINKANTTEQVVASLDALAKTLYERNFGSLVERVNRAVDCQKSDKSGFIGVLDIAGFEIFQENSFEQLCINYTNEKLQQFFNHTMFVLEQEEYQKEKIHWNYIDFDLDLQPTIDLIEKNNPVGILACLEEECLIQGSDDRFLQKLNKVWGKEGANSKYKPILFKKGFAVKHYAGLVEYSTTGWVDKNKDPLNENIMRLLARSTQHHVASLFEDYLSDDIDTSGRAAAAHLPSRALLKQRKGTGSFHTVGQRHKQQLALLMNTLEQTHPHFVRCILPNSRKRAGEIDTPLVLEQLRCNGVLEGIRICRKGFPNRLSFADFRKRYEILCPNLLAPNRFIDGRSACQHLLQAMELDEEKYRIGTTKVFFKASVLAELEQVRDDRLSVYITGFQAVCRRHLAERHKARLARQTEAIKVIQRNARIYVTLREWPWWKLYARLKPLNDAYRIQTQITERDQKIDQLKQELKAQSDQSNQLCLRNQELESQQTEYEKLVQSQQAIIKDLQDSKQSMLDKLTNAEERMDEMAREVDEARERVETLQSENASQAAMIARLHHDIRECSQDNDNLAQQCESLQASSSALLRETQQLEQENARITSEFEAFKANAGASKEALARMQAEFNDALAKERDKVAAQEQALIALKAQQEKDRQAYEQHQQEMLHNLTQAQHDLVENQHALAKETQLRMGLEKQCADLQSQLERAQQLFTTESKDRKASEAKRLEAVRSLQADVQEARDRAERMAKILELLSQ